MFATEMPPAIPLLAAALLAVSCNKQNTPPRQQADGSSGEPAVRVAGKIHVEIQAGLVTLTDRQSRLVAGVKDLSEGMSPREVMDRLGPPNQESPDLLFYNCVEGAEGGHFVNASLRFGDNGLASAGIGHGHVTLERRTAE